MCVIGLLAAPEGEKCDMAHNLPTLLTCPAFCLSSTILLTNSLALKRSFPALSLRLNCHTCEPLSSTSTSPSARCTLVASGLTYGNKNRQQELKKGCYLPITNFQGIGTYLPCNKVGTMPAAACCDGFNMIQPMQLQRWRRGNVVEPGGDAAIKGHEMWEV
jgi:hypothetical protein